MSVGVIKDYKLRNTSIFLFFPSFLFSKKEKKRVELGIFGKQACTYRRSGPASPAREHRRRSAVRPLRSMRLHSCLFFLFILTACPLVAWSVFFVSTLRKRSSMNAMSTSFFFLCKEISPSIFHSYFLD
jgi:hypothetical protein